MGHPVTAAGRNLLRDGSAGRITNDALRIRILAIEAEAAQDAARQRDEIRLPIRRCGHCNSWMGVAKEHECHREDTVIDAILSEYALLRATEGKQP